jgi:hypothetical protein
MDLLALYQDYGECLSFIGGIDAREISSGSRTRIDAELRKKVLPVKAGHGYCLHSDFSIPLHMSYDDFSYFLQRGIDLGS